MKTITTTTSRTETDVQHEVSGFLFTIVSASALILGIWGIACLASGLLNGSLMSLVRGYVTAITGM
jgi:hypothetical protein